MNKKLEKKLKEKYPEIFQDMYGNPKETCMAWGIECDDGWYNIIDDLCHMIQWHLNNRGEDVSQVVAVQIKEKFGGLRFYYDGGDDIVGAYVDFAERIADRTCEVCGAAGKPREGGWIKTLCDEHAENRSNPWEDVDK